MYPIPRHSGASALWLASTLAFAACASDTPLPASPDADSPTEVTAPTRPQAAAASVEHTTTHTEPFEILMSIPCANGGAGEDVQFGARFA